MSTYTYMSTNIYMSLHMNTCQLIIYMSLHVHAVYQLTPIWLQPIDESLLAGARHQPIPFHPMRLV